MRLINKQLPTLPFGNASTVDYDGNDLLAAETTDAIGNVVMVSNDYRVLAPVLLTDANGNQAAQRFIKQMKLLVWISWSLSATSRHRCVPIGAVNLKWTNSKTRRGGGKITLT